MSNVKRYGFPWLECDATDEAYMQENGMTELKDGGFVLWADYARLKAENERLHKASDVLAHSVNRFLTEHISDCDWLRDGLASWNAANEVQS